MSFDGIFQVKKQVVLIIQTVEQKEGNIHEV